MKVVVASNHGEIGGGEVMLLNIVRALRSLGHDVTVLAPSQPDELLEAARDEGFRTIALPAADRRAYMAQLRVWRNHNKEPFLWCNGLVPSLATSGDRNRLVHLHQLPSGLQKYAFAVARKGARLVLVPSEYIARRVKGSLACENWVAEIPQKAERKVVSPVRVGFLGRPALIKGTHTLAQAVKLLNDTDGFEYELIIGGEAKFVDADSQEQVQQAIAGLGERTQLMGWVAPEELFERSDILVVPSEVEESFGLVAAEAMSARQPLIVSDAGALPETVGEGYPWVFEQGNTQHLADTISALAQEMMNTPSTVADRTSDSYWRWQEKYSPEAGKARIGQIIQQLETQK